MLQLTLNCQYIALGLLSTDLRPVDMFQTPSYPTRSLNFLKALHKAEGSAKAFSEINGPKPSTLALNVLVVGAGLSGLATGIALARRGHAVTIFEQAPQMGEVG